MSRLRFTLRELLLVVLSVAMALGWTVDHYRQRSSLRYTGNPLDLAIEGEGFLTLIDERTTATVYSRRGQFSTNSNDMLVMRLEGVEWPVSPGICIPSDAQAIAITPAGLVLAQMPATVVRGPSGRGGITVRRPNISATGQIQLASFRQPAKLKQIAPSVFIDTKESGLPTIVRPETSGVGLVRQGMLDRNVSQKFSLNPWRW
jgi:flagellar basal-body rod protein FlgG